MLDGSTSKACSKYLLQISLERFVVQALEVKLSLQHQSHPNLHVYHMAVY